MGDLVMYFASKMGVDTKFDCFLTGYAILNIPLLGRVASYQLTCRRLSVDVPLATNMNSVFQPLGKLMAPM